MSLKYKNNIAEENGKFYGKIAIRNEQRQFLCQGAKTRSEAQAIVDAEKYKLRQELAGLRSKCENTRFSSLVTLYKAHSIANKARSHGDVGIMNNIKDYFKDTELTKITPNKIQKFLTFLVDEKQLAPASVNKYRSVLLKMFNLGIDNNKCSANPVRKIKGLRVDNTRTRVLSDKEEVKLYKVLNSFHKVKTREGEIKNFAPYKRVKRLITLALNSGMRKGEMINFRWLDIDEDFTIITVLNSKSGKSREIPINKKLRLALKAMYKLRGNNEFVFTNPETGTKYVDLKRIVGSLFEAAGLDDFTLHCCRHTFATRLLDKGVDIRTVQELLGHADIRMTERYTHSNKDKKTIAVNLI